MSAAEHHVLKVVAVSEKVAAKADGALAGLEQEMIIMSWPDEFRAIMWEAVAAIAQSRAASARMKEPAHTPAHRSKTLRGKTHGR